MGIIDDFVTPFKGLLRQKVFKKDNFLFWFFYRATVAIHILFTLVLGGKAYFGDPIDCTIRRVEVRGDVVDNYCWVTGTWTIKDKEPHEIAPNSVRRKVKTKAVSSVYITPYNVFIIFLVNFH